jgi:cell division initiation protein
MDLTGQAIRSVEFREKLRGYHPDDVDAFVEQVAVEVENLRRRVHELQLVTEASPSAAPGGDQITDETLRRTLLMAQRTADLVVKEAQEAAAATLSEAQARADAVVADAMVTADTGAVEVRSRVQAEVTHLEEARTHLRAEVAALQEYLDSQRARLRDLLTEQLHMLDDPQAIQLQLQQQLLPDALQAPVTTAQPGVEAAPSHGIVDLTGRTFDQPEALTPRAFDTTGDDPFLTELRRAVEEPGYPTPEGDAAAVEDAVEPGEAVEAGEVEGGVEPPEGAVASPSLFSGPEGPPVPLASTLPPGPPPVEDLPGMPEGGRLSGRLFRRR